MTGTAAILTADVAVAIPHLGDLPEFSQLPWQFGCGVPTLAGAPPIWEIRMNLASNSRLSGVGCHSIGGTCTDWSKFGITCRGRLITLLTVMTKAHPRCDDFEWRTKGFNFLFYPEAETMNIPMEKQKRYSLFFFKNLQLCLPNIMFATPFVSNSGTFLKLNARILGVLRP